MCIRDRDGVQRLSASELEEQEVYAAGIISTLEVPHGLILKVARLGAKNALNGHPAEPGRPIELTQAVDQNQVDLAAYAGHAVHHQRRLAESQPRWPTRSSIARQRSGHSSGSVL